MPATNGFNSDTAKQMAERQQRRRRMNPERIKAELIRRGVRQSQIAEANNVSRATVNDVITGRIRSDRIRAAIAMVLNLPIERIWAE